MSRNYELLRTRRESITDKSAAAATSETPRESELHPRNGDKVARRISERDDLVAAEIRSDEKREIGKMVNTLFPAIPPETSRLIAIAGVDESTAAARIAACASELLS